MLDGNGMYPKGFHPAMQVLSPDFKKYAWPRRRRGVRHLKYYFVDFGHARRYNPEDTNPLEVPILGGDKTVPEFQNDRETPRNPFHTDVYYMGNLIRRDFVEVRMLSM